jgi:ATP synthase F1 delta subunit
MSFTKKIVTTYSKALIQSLKDTEMKESSDDSFLLAKITSAEPHKRVADIYFLGEELLLIRSLIVSSKTINEFMNNPTYSETQKVNIILSIFPGLSTAMKAFLKILTQRSHLSLIPEISEEYTKTLVKFRNSTTVNIFIASGLKESYGLLLLNTLRVLTNSKEIILNAFYNPKLLGGIVIEYNSKSIDASILKEFSLFFNEI